MYGRRKSYKVARKSPFMRKATRQGFKPRRLARSLYDDGVYLKVEKTVELIVDGTGAWWSGARTDAATSTAQTDISYLDQPEYQAFSGTNTFQLCEVRGIRADVSIAQHIGQTDRIVASGGIFAGPARGIPIGAAPTAARLKGLPLQRQVNLQGQVSSLYLSVSNGLRSAGMPNSTQHNVPYPSDYGYAAYVYGTAGGFAANSIVGSCKFTFYIRLHQRKYLG